MADSEVITVLSLCSGYGGLELGLSRSLENPLRVIAVEVEAYALANLVAKTEEGKLAIEALWPDLRTFPAERFRGCCDFVLAGYPCQPFSHAGKRRGHEDPRHLWPHIARIIEAVEPVWVFCENVPGHLSLGFPEVYRSLRDMGYSVEAGLFTAAEVGAPHKRQRLFILAHDTQLGRRTWGAKPEGLSGATGTSERSSEDVAHSQRPEPWLRIRQEPQAGLGRDRPAIGGERLADASGQRVQGPEPEGPALTLRPTDEHGRTLWPARPGQPQYEWEEPRVMAEPVEMRKPQSQRSIGYIRRRLIHEGESVEPCPEVKHRWHVGDVCFAETGFRRYFWEAYESGQAQSGVGRAADGTRNRVDRLRLLGNGVVPQQAEKAFRDLYRKMQAG